MVRKQDPFLSFSLGISKEAAVSAVVRSGQKTEWVEIPLQLLEVYAGKHEGSHAFLSRRLGGFSSPHTHKCMHTDMSTVDATVEAVKLRVWMQ